jgi:hypothetical protein
VSELVPVHGTVIKTLDPDLDPDSLAILDPQHCLKAIFPFLNHYFVFMYGTKIIYPSHNHDLFYIYKDMGRRFVAIRIIPGPTLPEGSRGVTREPSAPPPGIRVFFRGRKSMFYT